MRIGYTRYNLTVQLSTDHCSDGSALMVVRILRELVKAGHEVTIYGEIHSQHEHLLRDGEDWHKALKYKPMDFPDEGIELLIVENGPTNITFNNKHWKIPHIARTHDIVRHYKGVVFYHQSDVALPMVFNPELFGYGFMTKWIQHGTAAELFHDKHWVVLTTSRDEANGYSNFRDLHNARRSSYKELDIPVEFLNFAQLSIEDKILEFNPNPKHFLCYTGSNRNGRIVKFKEFYEKVGVPTTLYGSNWKDAGLDPSIDFRGSVDMTAIPALLNDTRVQIMIGDLLFEKLRVLTNRFYEGISCRTLLLFDKDFAPTDIYPGTKDFIVANKEEARSRLKQLEQMPLDEIKKLTEQQLKWVTDHNDRQITSRIVELYKKHKAVFTSKSFEDKHLEPRKVWNKYAAVERQKKEDLYLLRFYDTLDKFCEINFDADGFLKTPNREILPVPGGYPQICFKCGSLIVPLRKPVAKIRCNRCSPGSEKAINTADLSKYKDDHRLYFDKQKNQELWDSNREKTSMPSQSSTDLMSMFGEE